MPPQTYPTLRERVRAVLLGAGFKAREDTIPGLLSGGTFDLISGVVVSVRVAWWDAPAGEKRRLLEEFAVALRQAGYVVQDRGEVLYVAASEKRGDGE